MAEVVWKPWLVTEEQDILLSDNATEEAAGNTFDQEARRINGLTPSDANLLTEDGHAYHNT